MAEKYALIKGFEPGMTLAHTETGKVMVEDFLADLARAAAALPPASHVLNLCNDRYHFWVLFAAALLRGQINLLPSSRAPEELGRVRAAYPDSLAVSDTAGSFAELGCLDYAGLRSAAPALTVVPEIPGGQVAAIVFTSGSTGQPQPHAKTWGSLAIGAELAVRRFGLPGRQPGVVVATVPQQHMYGLETTVLLPLQCGWAMHAGRPFYPADIGGALAALASPKVLVSTPVHLRACVQSGFRFPAVDFLLCATAPLPQDLAREAEQAFAAPLYEIYGCTEAGSLASRRSVETLVWQAYDGVRLNCDAGDCRAEGGHLAEAVALSDRLAQQDDGHFLLEGRDSDMVNIAGKRISLAYLNTLLLGIDGVADGAFFLPDEQADNVTRLTAFVVAPAREASEIMADLSRQIDPVFLPRPLILLDNLPRTENGKLPRARLVALAATCLKSAKGQVG